MSNSRDDGRARPPAAEPEIIPPGRPDPRWQGKEKVWVRQRVYVAPAGPLGVVVGLILLAALAGIGVVAFLGLFLLALPIAAAMVAAALLAALWHGPRRG